jgi:hypothetical protein
VRLARRRLAHFGPGQERAVGDFERVSLPTTDCDALRDLLVEEQARVVIEIGLAYGSSALAIAEALVSQAQFDVKHLIIDAFQGAHLRLLLLFVYVFGGALGEQTGSIE